MCHFCGPDVPGHYRRWVHTGSSAGVFWSRHSYGGSSREYTGLRTVCANCANVIDDQNRWNDTLKTWAAIAVAVIIGFVVVASEMKGKADASALSKTRQFQTYIETHPIEMAISADLYRGRRSSTDRHPS